ncbi:hypothetical protein D3C72_1565550 [compost metagenome]
MVVGNQQIAPALHQAHHGVVHVQRNQPAFKWPKLVVQARHPGREKRERQRVRHGELDHVLARAGVRPQHGTRVLQRLQHFQRLVVQGLASRSESGGVRAAVHQIGACPRLQRLNAPRKRGLRHVSQLGRPAEAARFRKTDEIFKPLGFHRRIIRAGAATCWHRASGFPQARAPAALGSMRVSRLRWPPAPMLCMHSERRIIPSASTPLLPRSTPQVHNAAGQQDRHLPRVLLTPRVHVHLHSRWAALCAHSASSARCR